MEGSVCLCPVGVGNGCYHHKYDSGSSKGWRTLFWLLETPGSMGPSLTFPSSAVATELFHFCGCCEHIFYKHAPKKIVFLCSQKNQQGNGFRHSTLMQESTFTFGHETGRPRIQATSFRSVTKLGSYWLFQNRSFSFSISLVWLLVCGMISVSSFWGITSNFVSWLCETERGYWILKMYHKIEPNDYFLTSTC